MKLPDYCSLQIELCFSHPEVSVTHNDNPGSYVLFLPFFHLYGGILMHLFLIAGKTTVIMQRFDFEAYLQLNVEHKVVDFNRNYTH